MALLCCPSWVLVTIFVREFSLPSLLHKNKTNAVEISPVSLLFMSLHILESRESLGDSVTEPQEAQDILCPL